LAVLIFEAMLLGSAERTTDSKDDTTTILPSLQNRHDGSRASVPKRSKQKARKKPRKP